MKDGKEIYLLKIDQLFLSICTTSAASLLVVSEETVGGGNVGGILAILSEAELLVIA